MAPDYERIVSVARDILAELGQQGGNADPDWHAKATRAIEDTIAAAAGALTTLDRLHGREPGTSRHWRSRCAEALDVGRAVVPNVILGTGQQVRGRKCGRCRRTLPEAVFTSAWCGRCQSDYYAGTRAA